MKQSIKLIIIIFILCLCGVYPAQASETYQIDSEYRIYDLQDNVYNADMPPLTYYPKIINYSNTNYLNLTMSNTTYQLNQTIQVNDIDSVLLGGTLISGTKYGNLGSYTQTFIYLNTDSDYYTFNFTLLQKRGGSGWIDIYAYVNSSWVKVEQYTDVGTSFTLGTIKPDSKVNGWKAVCHWELTNRFTLLRPDDTYADGYKFNEFSFTVKDSQQQEEDTQKSIEENTRNTNTILGTVKNAIDNVKSAIDNVVTSIINLPSKIANALKGFFDNIKDAIDVVITGITNLPGKIMDGLKALFIPTDFYGDLETAMNDIVDALGIVGYPISLYTKTCYVVRDTTTTSLTVDVPAFYYNGQTIFPRYHRDNIFYFQNKLVFENVQKTTWMRQFFGMFNADVDTITIGDLVKTLMSVLMWFGIISFIIRIYNKAFGVDVNEEMGDDDE